jgi:hypothetical protein
MTKKPENQKFGFIEIKILVKEKVKQPLLMMISIQQKLLLIGLMVPIV